MTVGQRTANFAAVRRDTLFSPNMVSNDDAIFNDVAKYIREHGYAVNFYTESEFVNSELSERNIFTMMRSTAAIKRLQEMENDGVRAVNSAFGIENCWRGNLTRTMMSAGIPHPGSLILRTDSDVETTALPQCFNHCWVKRADSQPTGKNDVIYIDDICKLSKALRECYDRGIAEVVVNAHLQGDLIKFYGVRGSDFFYHFYPQVNTHSKFGLEKINGAPTGIPFNEEELRHICSKTAERLNVHVYGGDCIVSPDGTIRIIDFNDWPSFSPCRDEAAVAIGDIIIKTLND